MQELQFATHAVLRHKQQAVYQEVQHQLRGVQVVSVQWLLLSALKKQLQDASEVSKGLTLQATLSVANVKRFVKFILMCLRVVITLLFGWGAHCSLFA